MLFLGDSQAYMVLIYLSECAGLHCSVHIVSSEKKVYLGDHMLNVEE